MAHLPPPRHPGRYRIAVVCLGNICRSPMAHVVLEESLAAAGLGTRVEVDSSGTAGWHAGKPMDRRAAATLTQHGYDASRHRAQQFEPSWHGSYDLVLAMDAGNHADLLGLAEGGGLPQDEAGGRLRMFRDYDPLATDDDRDVPDPYYGDDDGFEQVLLMVRRTSDALVDRLRTLLG